MKIENPVVLALCSIVLMIAAWLFPQMPITIFIAFVPLLVMVNTVDNKTVPLILAGLLFSLLLAAYLLSMSILGAVLLAFSLTLAITISQFINITLSNRLQKFTVLIVLLAIHYLVIKLTSRFTPIFLADVFRERIEWVTWNQHTGYLGGDAWVMLVNVVLYYAFVDRGVRRWIIGMIGMLLVIVPILSGVAMDGNALSKLDLLQVYYQGVVTTNQYPAHGEIIARTAAWVCVLMLIFTIVKLRTRK